MAARHEKALQPPGAFGKFVQMPKLRIGVYARSRASAEPPLDLAPISRMYARRKVAVRCEGRQHIPSCYAKRMETTGCDWRASGINLSTGARLSRSHSEGLVLLRPFHPRSALPPQFGFLAARRQSSFTTPLPEYRLSFRTVRGGWERRQRWSRTGSYGRYRYCNNTTSTQLHRWVRGLQSPDCSGEGLAPIAFSASRVCNGIAAASYLAEYSRVCAFACSRHSAR